MIFDGLNTKSRMAGSFHSGILVGEIHSPSIYPGFSCQNGTDSYLIKGIGQGVRMKVKTHFKPGWWYTVKSGDTLQKIAQKTYGNRNEWQNIYEYSNNAKIIGPNPNLIRQGISIQLW